MRLRCLSNMTFSIKIFVIGALLLLSSIFFILKNKKVAAGYQSKVVKNVYGKEVGESKGLGAYIRVRYYIAGALFIIIGMLVIVSSFA